MISSQRGCVTGLWCLLAVLVCVVCFYPGGPQHCGVEHSTFRFLERIPELQIELFLQACHKRAPPPCASVWLGRPGLTGTGL